MPIRLLGLLVCRVLAAHLAEFAHFQPFFEGSFVLVGIVVHAFAFGALQFDHVVLGHNGGLRGLIAIAV